MDKEQRYGTLVGIYLFSRNYSMGGWPLMVKLMVGRTSKRDEHSVFYSSVGFRDRCTGHVCPKRALLRAVGSIHEKVGRPEGNWPYSLHRVRGHDGVSCVRWRYEAWSGGSDQAAINDSGEPRDKMY